MISMVSCSCHSQEETKFVYACSGCADVGEIADQVSRKLGKDGFGNVSCLAGVGAGFSGFINAAKTADIVMTIDGCEVGCAKKTIENIDIQPKSFILTKMGLQKGKSSISTDLITSLCKKIVEAYY